MLRSSSRSLLAACLQLAAFAGGGAFAQAPPAPPELSEPGGALYLNAGGVTILDGIGRFWQEDLPWLVTPSNVAFFAEEFVTFDLSLIGDPNFPPGLLASERWRDGEIGYLFPVANAPYRVILYFLEFCGACVGPAMGGSGCAGCARIFDVEVEGVRVNAFNQSDAARLPAGDGAGSILAAVELSFTVAVADGALNVRILDRGGGNPPENSAIKGMAIQRLPSELETAGGTLRLNAGGPEIAVDAQTVWRQDAKYLVEPTNVAPFPGAPVELGLLGDAPPPAEVFRSERWRDGHIHHRIPVRGGIYRTEVLFAEMCPACVGPALGGSGCAGCIRRFDVDVEGSSVLAYSPADAARPPHGDGVGAVQRATRLLFHTPVEDGFLDVRILDHGPGNPPENSQLNGLTTTRLDANVLPVGQPIDFLLRPTRTQALFLVRGVAFRGLPVRPLRITARAAGRRNVAGLYLRWGDLPTPQRFDLTSTLLADGSAILVVPFFQQQDCLLLLRAHALESITNVTLLAESGDMFLEASSPARAQRGERATLSIRGAGFTGATSFLLRRPGGGLIAAAASRVLSWTRAEAEFNLAGAALETLDLVARHPQFAEAVLDDALTVIAAGPQLGLDYRLSGFGSYRRNEVSRMFLRYQNLGGRAIAAPLFLVSGPAGAQLGLHANRLAAGPLQVLGVDSATATARLAPGRAHEIPIYFRHSQAQRAEYQVRIFSPGAGEALELESLPPPPGLSANDWRTLSKSLKDRLGPTWRDYHEGLAGIAARLAARGGDAADVGALFRFASRPALGANEGAAIGQVIDSFTSQPVKNVTITARSASGMRSHTRSGADGIFAVDWLAPGGSFTIEARGYSMDPIFATIPQTGDAGLGVIRAAFQPTSLGPGGGLVCPDCRDDLLPDGPALPPSRLFIEARAYLLEEILALDPNEKKGPRKPERPGKENEVCPGEEIQYEIRFENTGNAAARQVAVVDQLDTEVFDLSSFRFLDVQLPGQSVPPPSGVESGSGVFSSPGLDQVVEGVSETGAFCVEIGCFLDPATGLLDCLFRTIDPITEEAPLDPALGFLAPGESGAIRFAATPKEDELGQGTEIKNRGKIVFDAEAPIFTSETRHLFSACEPEPFPAFRRGDANTDSGLDIADASFTLGFLFLGTTSPRCDKALDANDDGRLDLADATRVLNFLFLGGAPPPAPFTACGQDSTADALGCAAFPACR